MGIKISVPVGMGMKLKICLLLAIVCSSWNRNGTKDFLNCLYAPVGKIVYVYAPVGIGMGLKIFYCQYASVGIGMGLKICYCVCVCSSWNRNGTKLLSASTDWNVLLWDVASGEIDIKFRFQSPILKVQFHPRST